MDKLQINFLKSVDVKLIITKCFCLILQYSTIYPSNSLGSIRCMYNFVDIHQIHNQIEDYDLVCQWKKNYMVFNVGVIGCSGSRFKDIYPFY